MQNGVSIELAVRGLERIDLAQFGLQSRIDHYWRVRWFEQGEEVDHIELMDDLAGMQRMARSEGGAAWRYYETDVFADEREQRAYLVAHGQSEGEPEEERYSNFGYGGEFDDD